MLGHLLADLVAFELLLLEILAGIEDFIFNPNDDFNSLDNIGLVESSGLQKAWLVQW